MDQELFLERLRWPDVQAALERGMTTVVFACGAVEQHGPHLPLFMDAEHGTRLALEVARRLGNALVAPTIRVGCSEHHMAFPGTVSIQPATLEALCRDYCTSLARHGFRRILIIPSHGGNFAPIDGMLERLRAAVAPAATVESYTDLVTFIGVLRQATEAVSGLGARVLGHADIAESSIMLMLWPELVRVDAAEAGLMAELTPELMQRVFRDGFRAVTPNGILGDARGMSAAIGERCVAALADVLAARFATVAEAPVAVS